MESKIYPEPGKSLPSAKCLWEILDANPATGDLTWKARDISYFTKPHLMKSWNSRLAGKPAFACDNKGYLVGNFCGRTVSAHRVVWKMFHGDEPDEVDHINGVRSDNRLANLRATTRLENGRNLPLRKSNVSGVSGVTRFKSDRWRAHIKIRYKQIHLGVFDSQEDAITARRNAEIFYNFHSRERLNGGQS
jgi:hypothetical protein